MANVQSFGIVTIDNDLNDILAIGFEYKKYYGCVDVEDDFLTQILIKRKNDFNQIKTFYSSLDRPNHGLAHCGDTLIPPKSLIRLREIIITENQIYKSNELEKLIEKINEAIKENRYMVHFGL